MNCDQAFEHITDAALRHSPALQRHLQTCPRCRQMQETLAPALAYFDGESAGSMDAAFLSAAYDTPETGAEAADLFLSPEAVEIAEQAARQLSARRPAARLQPKRLAGAVLRCAAIFFIGALTAFGFFGREAVHRVPAAQKESACTRQLAAEADAAVAGMDAPNFVRSCIACHLASHEAPAGGPESVPPLRAPTRMREPGV